MVWQDGCFLALGVILITIGTYYRLGQLRQTYWFIPFSYYRTAGYGLIAIGLSLLVAVIARLFLDTLWMIPLRIIMIASFIVGLYMWLFQPRFAKPDWINWLEDNHADILPELRQEVFRMGLKKWDRMIKTQADLEAWVDEVRLKHGLR